MGLARGLRVLARGVIADVARALVGRATASPATRRTPRRTAPSRPVGTYPGDFPGVPPMAWAPRSDDRPDAGEVVWAWVPYEDDHSRGKDRPVLVVGRDGRWLLGLPLTSKDHDRDAAQEARAGRTWVDVGTGPWDRRGRASEVRTNRVVRIDPSSVRREGGVLDRARFEQVRRAVLAARR